MGLLNKNYCAKITFAEGLCVFIKQIIMGDVIKNVVIIEEAVIKANKKL